MSNNDCEREMRGRLLSVWYKEDRGDYVIYWQVFPLKWDLFWIVYVLYSVINVIAGLWFFRKIGCMKKKATIQEWMLKYPRYWANPMIVPKNVDERFDYEKMMENRFAIRSWDRFPSWMGFGIGPFSI